MPWIDDKIKRQICTLLTNIIQNSYIQNEIYFLTHFVFTLPSHY